MLPMDGLGRGWRVGGRQAASVWLEEQSREKFKGVLGNLGRKSKLRMSCCLGCGGEEEMGGQGRTQS